MSFAGGSGCRDLLFRCWRSSRPDGRRNLLQHHGGSNSAANGWRREHSKSWGCDGGHDTTRSVRLMRKQRILVAFHVTYCNEMRRRIGTVAQQGRAFRHHHIPGIRSACLRRHLRGREHNRLHPRHGIVGRRFVGRSVAQAGPDDGLCPCQKDRPTRTSWEQHPTARGQRYEAKVRSEVSGCRPALTGKHRSGWNADADQKGVAVCF